MSSYSGLLRFNPCLTFRRSALICLYTTHYLRLLLQALYPWGVSTEI